MLASQRTDSPEAYSVYLEAEALFEQGKELESLEPVIAAIDRYEQAITLDEAFSVAYARLARSAWLPQLLPSGSYRGASCQRPRDGCTRLGARPRFTRRPLRAGPGPHRRGRHPSALQEYTLVVQRWPNYAQAFWSLSLYNTFACRWDEALEFAEKARELNPRAARHHCQVGGMNIAKGNYEGAISHHQFAIGVAPERACPYYCLLEATISMGDVERAQRVVDEIPSWIDIEESPSIGFHWVRLEIIQGRFTEALERLSSGPAEAYRAAWIYVPKSLLAAQIHELMGQPDEARQHYDSAREHLEPRVESAPFDARYRASLAIAYAGLGRREDALRQEDTGLPTLERGGMAKPFSIREFAHARVLLGDHDEAVSLLRQHLELSGYLGSDYLKLYPTWDPLRDRPDFRALMEQYSAGDPVVVETAG